MSDSVWPQRRQPTRLPRPWDSPGKNTGVGCHVLLQCMKVKSENEVAQSCLTLSDPGTAAYQAPPSMGFSRKEYWSRVPLPSPYAVVYGKGCVLWCATNLWFYCRFRIIWKHWGSCEWSVNASKILTERQSPAPAARESAWRDGWCGQVMMQPLI